MKRITTNGLLEANDGWDFSFTNPYEHLDDFHFWPAPVQSAPAFSGEIMPDRALKVADLASNTSTTALLSTGQTYSSIIDTSGDVDWIKVTLSKGQSYALSAYDKDAGGGTIDGINIVGLYNSAGQLISGTSVGVTDSVGETINYTATSTGSYYLAVAGSSAQATGSYTVAAAVKDSVAPILVGVTPADDATKVAKDANITLTFSEKVHAGAGNLTLTGSDGSKTVIDMGDSSQVSYSGTTVTINPNQDLHAGVTYSVTLDADAVRDYSSNHYAGLLNTTSLNFTVDGVASASLSQAAPTEATGHEWNVMVYIAGDNNLESYGIADLNEMEKVLGLPSNVVLTVLFDRAAGYSTASGNWTDTRVGVVTYDGNNITNSSLASSATSWGELDTGSPTTLTKFINWSSSTYAANHYGLVMWDHGGGIYGAAWDSGSSNDNLTLKEMSSAIAASNVQHFDVIGFDACLMQMAETTTQLAPYADYIVGSEDYVPGDGFAYDKLFTTFVSDSNVTGKELADAMVSTYSQAYGAYSGVQISSVDTSKIAELVKDMDAFDTRALGLSKSGADWTALKTAAANAYQFGADDGFHFADLKDFMTRFAANASDATLKSLAGEIISDVTAAVSANGGTEAQAKGLAIYLPNGSDAVYSGYTDSNFAWAAHTHWDDMLAYL